jgi:hypothetical protein
LAKVTATVELKLLAGRSSAVSALVKMLKHPDDWLDVFAMNEGDLLMQHEMTESERLALREQLANDSTIVADILDHLQAFFGAEAAERDLQSAA